MQGRITLPTTKESIDFFKKIINNKDNIVNKSEIVEGGLYFYNYNAKNKEETYDKKPLVFVLKIGSKSNICVNFHWAPRPLKVVLIKYFIMNNRKNIKSNKPLQMDYKKLKPFLKKIGFAPIIRRHLRGRIHGKVVNIPSSELMYAAMADTAVFTNGKISAEELYKRAIAGNKKYRSTRKRRE